MSHKAHPKLSGSSVCEDHNLTFGIDGIVSRSDFAFQFETAVVFAHDMRSRQ